MGAYLNYLKKLDYPEYAQQEAEHEDMSLALLDLSFDDGQRIKEEIYRIVQESDLWASEYHFTQNEDLLRLISGYVGTDQSNILITSGGDGALRVVTRALVDQGTKVCIPLPSFGRFEYHAKTNQGDIVFLSPSDFPYDIDFRYVAEFCVNHGTEVLFLANPNNPTGIYKSLDKVEWLLKQFSGYVILDEALVDYVGETAVPLVNKYPNLIVTRSFSKLFGLSGMRIGYIVVNEELAKTFKTLVSPFEVNTLSILLASEMLKNHKDLVSKKRLDLLKSLKLIWKHKSNSLEMSPTQASTFVLRNKGSHSLYDILLQNGVRTVSSGDFRGIENENTVRISIKEYSDMKKLMEICESIETSL